MGRAPGTCSVFSSVYLSVYLYTHTHVCVHVCSVTQACPTVTPWTVARQSPLSMELFRQQYWSGLPFPPPGDLPNPGIKPAYFTYVNMPACDSSRISHLQRPHTQVDALCLPCGCAPWLWTWQTPRVSAPSNDCRTEFWGGRQGRREGEGRGRKVKSFPPLLLKNISPLFTSRILRIIYIHSFTCYYLLHPHFQ